MKYTPPIGGAANDPYVDANPATGVEGSPVPAAAIEHPQREIANVITGAGLTPDVGDLNQLYQAIQRIAVGGDYKASVRAATTANIALTALQTVDGVALAAGDRVLVKDQTAGAENGIYLASANAWTRTTDADAAGELTSGTIVPVESGTLNADTIWMLTTDGAITIGTTALSFVSTVVGDASTTVKGKVQLATSAEAQALTDALKALTPATLASALKGTNQGLAGNGYQKLPGGLIIQWGSVAGSGSAVTFTYPIAFPNNVFQALVGDDYSGAQYNANIGPSAITTTKLDISSGGPLPSVQLRVLVIGN
ncbi:MAG: hypothetical protein M0Z99_22615 [Betaproteobacteria bacterium]|nr:hypothetical protein [Betaproteobacteria bacterium]